jgi:hypothetical protein
MTVISRVPPPAAHLFPARSVGFAAPLFQVAGKVIWEMIDGSASNWICSSDCNHLFRVSIILNQATTPQGLVIGSSWGDWLGNDTKPLVEPILTQRRETNEHP